MKVLLAGVVTASVVSAPFHAHAQNGNGSPGVTQPFRLHPETGCFNYVGDAVTFVGRFRAGAYVSVLMEMVDDPTDMIPPGESRIPSMDAPWLPSSGPESWFGPLSRGGEHSITFVPRAFHGTTAIVTICGRMSAPPQ